MHVFAQWARWAITVLVAGFFFGLTLLPAIQIVLRLIGKPFIGAEELARFFLICMIFLSYPLVVANKENIVMGELKHMLTPAVRARLEAGIDIVSMVLTLFVAYAAWQTALGNMKSFTPTLAIPFWVFLSCTFLGFLCAGVIHAADVYMRFFAKHQGPRATAQHKPEGGA